MSVLLISGYISELEKLTRFGGDKKETSLRRAFANLLTAYCQPHDLALVDELEYITKTGARVVPDGTLKDALRLTHGYWESKDENDDLDQEIAKKLAKGYPSDNILFEDKATAVLLQNGVEVDRANMRDAAALDDILQRFVNYERPELRTFRRAIAQFSADLPAILGALRDLLDRQISKGSALETGLLQFLAVCQKHINPDLELADMREMLIQHILTEDIFYTIFNDTQFHRENNIARELQKLADTFFVGSVKKNALRGLESYYGAIKQSAAGIANHHEKQQFLKAIYANFYKVYNPNAADRLGVVYTPGEIVRFMIQGCDHLLHEHFGKLLSSKGVEILDPAVGTGTFITDLIEHFSSNKKQLAYKYANELQCNEVGILPYYIANLNIEFTYAQAMGEYAEFPHICFADTLDNLGFTQTHSGRQEGFDFGISLENTERVKRQNAKKISVIIGNPPYNANQLNENDNNKNRPYPEIDKRIKNTYIKESAAHKTKLYDMYARFFRWASDRLEHDGIVAFITNRSFIDSRTYDGFRKVVASEFAEVYVVDLGGDVRANPQLSGTTHNVFGIQTGVAISFLVKKKIKKTARIWYTRRPEFELAKDKLAFLESTRLADIQFDPILPDPRANWIDLEETGYSELLPLVLPKLSGKKHSVDAQALFRMFSQGPVSNRDEWVFDWDEAALTAKVEHYINTFNRKEKSLERPLSKDWEQHLGTEIKWTQDARAYLKRGEHLKLDSTATIEALYRPYVKKWYYYSKWMNWSLYKFPTMFPHGSDAGSGKNRVIAFSGPASSKPFQVLASDTVGGLDLLEKTVYLPEFVYVGGIKQDNITDWGLAQFQARYPKERKAISKTAIFYYVYAVLHDPLYREAYKVDLRRELPRIPFEAGFAKCAEVGRKLMELHISFDQAKRFHISRKDVKTVKVKPILQAFPLQGVIKLDTETTLSGIPDAAWGYKFGNRSALEWVLNQYQPRVPKDATVRKLFNHYDFQGHKKEVIELLERVCTVSLQTQEIIATLKN